MSSREPAPADRPCGCVESVDLAKRVKELEERPPVVSEERLQLEGWSFERVAEAIREHGNLTAALAAANAELAALRSRLDPGVPENVRRVARALESSFRARHTDLADGCWFEDAAAALKAALSGGG